MLNVTSSAKSAIAGNGRTFKARITVNGNILDSVIRKITFTYGSCGADIYNFGSVFTSYADISLSSLGIAIADKEMFIEVGVVLPDGSVEYIPMGYFTAGIADIQKARSLVTIKGSDRLATTVSYLPTIEFPATIQEVIDDMETQTGFTIKTSLDTSGTIEKSIEGTVPSVLSVLSGLLGGFCYCDRNGNIVIAAHPTTTAATVYEERCSTVQTSEDKYTIETLTVIASAGGTDPLGDEVEEVSFSEGSGTGISVENAYMTQALFDAMKGRIVGYSFDSCTARFMGDPTIEQCDAIELIDYNGDSYFVPCMSLIHEFDGGFTTEIVTPSKSSSDASAQGPVQQAVENLKIALLTVEKLLAKKIVAERIDVEDLFAQEVEATNLIITGLSKFLSKTSDRQVLIENARIDISALTDSASNPILRIYLNDELKGQIQYTGMYGYGDGMNKYPFVGTPELSNVKVNGNHLYDIQAMDISSEAGYGYTITRSTYEGATSCVLASGLVVLNERIQIKTTSTIEAGTEIVLGCIDDDSLYPKSMTALSVYTNTSNARRWTACVNKDGEIIARPSTSLSSGYTYTVYLSGIYMIGSTVNDVTTNVPGTDIGDDSGTVIVVDTYTVPSTAVKGAEAECSIVAESSIGAELSYQWYFKNTYENGSYDTTFTPASSGTSNIWNAGISATSTIVKREVYCVIKDTENHSVTTATKEIHYTSEDFVSITNLTGDLTVNEGESYTLSFTAEALVSGISISGYQWESSYGSSGSWQELTSGTSSSYTTKVSNVYYDTTYYYRCKIKLSNGDYVYTDEIEVVIKNVVETTTHTVSNNLTNASTSNSTTSVSSGSSYTATLTASSGYKLSNVIVTMGGVDVTSEVYSNGKISISSVTGNIVITASATETVASALQITSQPTDMTTSASSSVTFTIEATGDGLSFDWQYSTDGGETWTSITANGYTTIITSTETTSSYTLKYVYSTVNGRMYRCVVTDSNGNTATSNEVTLTVA